MKIVLSTRALAFLDTWGHRLHVPKLLLGPVCDAYDRRLLSGSPWVLQNGVWTSNANWSDTTSSSDSAIVTGKQIRP